MTLMFAGICVDERERKRFSLLHFVSAKFGKENNWFITGLSNSITVPGIDVFSLTAVHRLTLFRH